MAEKIKPATCEIITIGSELMLGQIDDTNSSFLSRELCGIGVSVDFRTAVGDSMKDIVKALRIAAERCDMVITTGGLGPTVDDITREAVSEAAQRDLEFREDLMEEISRFFRQVGIRMPDNNRRQAFIPSGSRVISNPVGTAPAFISELEGVPVICLPGVPRELEYLMKKEVLPWIREKFRLKGHKIVYSVLKTVGIGEGTVDEMIREYMGEGKNPEVGLLASMGEIKIRIAASAGSEEEARNMIIPVEKSICSILGDSVFGRDEETLEGVIESHLVRTGLTLSVLETFSMGMMASRLLSLPSNRVVESFVIPSGHQLRKWLNGNDPLEQENAARLLCREARYKSGSDLAVSMLGFPEKKDGGYVVNGYVMAAGDDLEYSFQWRTGGDPISLSLRAATIGLNTLRLALIRGAQKKENAA